MYFFRDGTYLPFQTPYSGGESIRRMLQTHFGDGWIQSIFKMLISPVFLYFIWPIWDLWAFCCSCWLNFLLLSLYCGPSYLGYYIKGWVSSFRGHFYQNLGNEGHSWVGAYHHSKWSGLIHSYVSFDFYLRMYDILSLNIFESGLFISHLPMSVSFPVALIIPW